MMTDKVERNYVIPLRAGFIKVPKYYRSKRAINQIKDFVIKHMKVSEVKIGKNLNEFVWQHGIKNPPGKVKVKVIKDASVASVELEGFEYAVEKVQVEKTDAPTSLKDKLASKLKRDSTTQSAQDVKEDSSEGVESKPKKKVSKKKVSEDKSDE